MKTTGTRTRVIKERAVKVGARRGQLASSCTVPASPAAAGDRQIAEIERTFTLRYEW
jgi:hypothetical protein